ncbi:6997_t:CDS:10 [Diversispora eburnea]|uniref:6997_t:CDS:1 n=1 Tax=Diversispora eburnea TaxID=1213867 RepID=A0A9N8V3X0_9GLOM|nr:6997_t:CDS:10 [Diversispora eburnea]
MDPLIFTAPARIRVLLVPVHPIKASTFHKKVELVKKFSVVKLGDVTPDMRGDHSFSNRCFAFDPSENQPDDTKGLIMIPNVGNIEFYISTMISDFANNILTEFGNLVKLNNSMFPLTPPSTAMTTAGMGGTTAGVNPKDNPFHVRSFSSSTIASIANQAANMPNTMADMKLKKRAAGRTQKLIADLYLMAGRLPDAVSHYSMAIETTKSNGDHLWHGSAIEGLCVGLILAEYLHTDVGYILNQAPPSPNPQSQTIPPIETPKSLWEEIVEKYHTVLLDYFKTSNSSYNQVPPLIYTEACLKVAKMLAYIWAAGGWGDDALKLIVHGGIPEKGKWGLGSLKWMSKADITQWAMKGYGRSIVDMSITEQIHVTTTISTIFSIINFRRKHAFFLRQTSLLITPLLVKPRNNTTQTQNKSSSSGGSGGNDGGLLSCLKKVTEVYGVGDNVDNEDYSVAVENARPLTFGWPDLQIDVLKDSIMVTEVLPDYPSIVKYTTRLLRKLFIYLPRDEQIRLSGSLPRVVASGKKQGLEMEFKYWGVNIVQETDDGVDKPIDPFLYKSFNVTKVETVQTHLVTNETAYFLISLTNPFAFDLDIQSISVSTEGVNFTPNSLASTITANTSITLRVSGVPTEPGELVVRGFKIKVHGCLEQEFSVLNHSGHHRELSQSSNQSKKEYIAEFLKVTVITEQPLMKIKSTSLMHGAIMLFEGENLSFQDSSTANAQALLKSSSDIPPEEAYEMELYAHKLPVFSWEPPDKPFKILPAEEFVLNISLFGKRGW